MMKCLKNATGKLFPKLIPLKTNPSDNPLKKVTYAVYRKQYISL